MTQTKNNGGDPKFEESSEVTIQVTAQEPGEPYQEIGFRAASR
jgi:hypothetical protein